MASSSSNPLDEQVDVRYALLRLDDPELQRDAWQQLVREPGLLARFPASRIQREPCRAWSRERSALGLLQWRTRDPRAIVTKAIGSTSVETFGSTRIGSTNDTDDAENQKKKVDVGKNAELNKLRATQRGKKVQDPDNGCLELLDDLAKKDKGKSNLEVDDDDGEFDENCDPVIAYGDDGKSKVDFGPAHAPSDWIALRSAVDCGASWFHPNRIASQLTDEEMLSIVDSSSEGMSVDEENLDAYATMSLSSMLRSRPGMPRWPCDQDKDTTMSLSTSSLQRGVSVGAGELRRDRKFVKSSQIELRRARKRTPAKSLAQLVSRPSAPSSLSCNTPPRGSSTRQLFGSPLDKFSMSAEAVPQAPAELRLLAKSDHPSVEIA